MCLSDFYEFFIQSSLNLNAVSQHKTSWAQNTLSCYWTFRELWMGLEFRLWPGLLINSFLQGAPKTSECYCVGYCAINASFVIIEGQPMDICWGSDLMGKHGYEMGRCGEKTVFNIGGTDGSMFLNCTLSNSFCKESILKSPHLKLAFYCIKIQVQT